MNRRERRAAQARARKLRTGYLDRLANAFAAEAIPRGEVSYAAIEHDQWCNVYVTGECNCVPNISISFPGGQFVVVEVDGTTRKVAAS